tara:strand:+ start:280 stop:879 length:600 start_codon:yes stop_codon:yes gene_type:complete
MKNFSIFFLFCLLSLSALAQEVSLEPDSLTKKSVIKMEFFSPLTGNTTFGYERYLKNFTSIEFKIGIIGLGKKIDEPYRDNGVFVKVGPKFKLKPSYATEGTFGTHLLRGSYIRPELALSIFGHEDFDRSSESITAAALLINYGNQYILGKVMSLDWHVGLGYGFSNDDDQGYFYGFSAGGNDFPMAFSAGFTLGVLLK